MSNWSRLPPELVLLITENLESLSDYISVCSVCKPWRLTAIQDRYRPRRQLPGFLIPCPYDGGYNENPRHCRFLPVNKTKLYCEDESLHRQLPQLILPGNKPYFSKTKKQQILLVGSSGGWLVMLEKHESFPSMHLLNPITGSIISLPPLTTLPWQKRWPRRVERAVLSSSPSTITASSPCYILIDYCKDFVGFCKLGDKSWKFAKFPSCSSYRRFEKRDALYYKGKFYIMDLSARLCVLDLSSSSPIIVEVIPYSSIALLSWSVARIPYLVNIEGQLILVFKEYNLILAPDLKVFRLDWHQRAWKYTNNLGKYALFMGMNHQIFYLLESDAAGVERNHIYSAFQYLRQRGFRSYEFYNIANSLAIYHPKHYGYKAKIFKIDHPLIQQHQFWFFTPVPWDPVDIEVEVHRIKKPIRRSIIRLNALIRELDYQDGESDVTIVDGQIQRIQNFQ